MDERRSGFWTSRRITHAVFTLALASLGLIVGIYGMIPGSSFSGLVVGLGYPSYFPPLIGLAYVLGAAGVMQGRRHRLREWAYAGFSFSFVAASWSQLNAGEVVDSLPPVLMLGILLVSYGSRGASGGAV